MFARFKPLETVKTYLYGVASMHHEDPFVKEALESFAPDIIEKFSLDEWTKKGANVSEVENLFSEMENGRQNEDVVVEPFEMRAINEAIATVRHRLRSVRVEPLSLAEAVDTLHTSTSAGYGYKGKSKGEVLDSVIEQAEALILQAKMGKPFDVLPSLLGTRGHLRKWTSKKRRIVFITPAAHTLIEQMFSVPITKAIMNLSQPFMFFGRNVIPRLRERALTSKRHAYTIGMDFTGFDRNVTSAILTRAFALIEEMIDFEHWKGVPVGKAIQKRYRRVWEYVKYYFMHTPVMTPSGRLTFYDGGVISGSGFTQLMDSICSAIYTYTFTYLEGNAVNELVVLGDDVFADVAFRPDLRLWTKWSLELFRTQISEEKTKIVSSGKLDRSFLGYTFKGGYLWRPEKEFFNLLLHPERKVDTVEKSFSRLIAYMMLGGYRHWDFSRFFEYFQSGYEIQNVNFDPGSEMEGKRRFGGMSFPVKGLKEYTYDDFARGLISFKDH